MTDVQTEVTETTVEVVEEGEGKVFDIPVVKGKTSLKMVSKDVPDDVYEYFFLLGAKQVLNRGMTKITKEAFPDPEALKAAAMAKAEENLAAIYAGKVRMTGGIKTESKERGVVMTEARRIARSLIKDELKRQKIRLNTVEAKDITKSANALIAAPGNEWIIEQAREEVKKREEAASRVKVDISGIAISAKKLKEAEAKRAEKVLSAAKAGQIVTRGRPQPRA